MAQVLAQVGIGDQAELIRALLLASAKGAKPQQLFAVAGPYLVEVVAGAAKLIPLPPALGPLRSVQAGADGSVWIGARGGVMRVDPAKPDEALLYRDPAAVSAMGFNAVVQVRSHVWGTHGDAGLVCWETERTENPVKAIRAADAGVAPFSPRNLTVRGSRVFLTSGNQLLTVDDSHGLKHVDIPTATSWSRRSVWTMARFCW